MPMELVLKGVRGPYVGRTAVLRHGELLIGRDPGNNVPLVDDPQASRVHAKLYLKGGAWYVADLGSTNGTAVDGKSIGASPIPLRSGITLGVGSSVFQVELRSLQAPSPVPHVKAPLAAAPLPPVLKPAPRPWGRALQEALSVYEKGLRDVIRDGVVTTDEVGDLMRVQARLGLTDQDTLEMRAQGFVYVTDLAIQANRQDLLDANDHLLDSFGLAGVGHPAVVAACRRVLAHVSMLSITSGTLPVNYDSDLNLYDDEVSHIELEANLMEERVVKSGWVSGHSGLSFRVAKGVRFNVGATRGHRISERAVAPVSHGVLAITSERIAYLGNPKSFEVKWSKVMGIEPYSDGMTIYIANRAKAPTVVYDWPDMAEIVAAVCSAYIS